MSDRIPSLVNHMRHLFADREDESQGDGTLLERFVQQQDEAAFAALVRRHGSMVLGVCRRILGDAEDADDAFQATFLTLACKGSSLRRKSSVAGWLYQVAGHVAGKARARAARRREREHQAVPPPRPEPAAEITWRELSPILDEELRQLPEKLRAPLLLCGLEGKTAEQAAEALGWPVGSISKRLARGRELLRQRLARHGFVLSTAALAMLLAESARAAVPPALARTTSRTAGMLLDGPAAAGSLPAAVAVLLHHSLRALALARLKLVAAVAGLALLLTTGGLLLHQAEAGPPASAEPPPPAAAAPAQPPPLKPLLDLRHGSLVVTLAYSPDGKLLVSGGGFRDSSIQLWDAVTGRRLHRLGGHEAGVSSVAFAPDGKTLASAGWAAELILWDVASGKETNRLPVPQVGITSLAFAPDGKALASATLDNTVHLWDLANRKEIVRLDGQEKTNKGEIPVLCAFSPDGSLLAVVNRGRNSEVCVWDVATAKERHRFKSGYEITSVAFAPDGKTLACEEYEIPRTDHGRHESIGLWDLATGRKVEWFAPARSTEKNYVIASRLAYAPDGKTVASANSDGSFSLWEIATGRERFRDRGPAGWATCLMFAPDGKTLATGSAAGIVRVWEVASLYHKTEAAPARLKPGEVEARWRDLAGDDAPRAHTAMMELTAAAGDSLPLLAERLQPLAFDRRKVEQLVRDLDSDQFATRQQASDELEKLGALAEGALRQALADKPSLEVSRRVEKLLEKIERPASGERLRRLRAVEGLERLATPAARQVLAQLAGGPPGLRETEEARSALQRLERQKSP